MNAELRGILLHKSQWPLLFSGIKGEKSGDGIQLKGAKKYEISMPQLSDCCLSHYF